MERLTIPNTTLEVSTLCLGCGGFGTRVRGDAADRLVAAFVEAGGRFFDTAHCYAFWEPESAGCSERELAACLRRLGIWGRVVVATKGGHPDAGEHYRRPDAYLAPEVIASDIDDSLANLAADRIDLYFLHRDDARVPVGEIVDALNAEIARGRIRYLGASNWRVERIAAANDYATRHGLQGFAVSQVQASLAEPSWPPGPDPVMRCASESDLACHRETGIPVVAYSATANGFFAGPEPKPGPFDTPANRARFDRARALAAQLGCTPTQVAVAYLLCQGAPVIPLFSTTSLDHLREVLGALDVPLTAEQVRWLREG